MLNYLGWGIGALVLVWAASAAVETPAEEQLKIAQKAGEDERNARRKRDIQEEVDKMTSVGCTKDKSAYIGEHSSRTVKCGWGKPEKINKTTTSRGVREQWVYPSGNYLYFYDGVLTTIQN
jgi:hypothetical protein